MPGILLLGLIIVAGSDFPVRASEGKLPTVWAEGTVEEVRQAIAKGEKVNTEAGTLTPLMAAASDTVNGLEKVKLLLHAGANKNAKGPGNSTALLDAITKQNYPVALLLLNDGAEVYSTTDPHQTALITAIAALPAITSFKSDDTILKSQIEAWQLLVASRTKPNSVTVKNNPPAGNTKIFAGNLVFHIPSSLAKEIDAKIGYTVYFYPDGQQLVRMYEVKFSKPADGTEQLKSLYDEALKFHKKFHDDPVGECITDQLNQPGFLVTTVCVNIMDKISEDIPDEGKKLKMYLPSYLDAYVYLPSHLDAYVKLAQGYLSFYMLCDYGRKDPIHDQDKIKQNLNDRRNSILTLIKEVMPHYKWVGDEAVTIGSNYRTRFGLINQAGLYLNPKFRFGINFLKYPAMQMSLTVNTHEWGQLNTYWLYYLLQNFIAHDGQEAKEFSIAHPRKVYGRWGMQHLQFNMPGNPPVVLTWTEFPTASPGNHDPLFIKASFFKLAGDIVEPLDAQSVWELWNNFLDNIEVLP